MPVWHLQYRNPEMDSKRKLTHSRDLIASDHNETTQIRVRMIGNAGLFLSRQFSDGPPEKPVLSLIYI